MTPRGQHGSTLSARRAFVVHFSTAVRTRRRRFSGRVEHLESGESMHFSSLKALLAFFAALLDASAGTAHDIRAARPDEFTTAEPARPVQPVGSAVGVRSGSIPSEEERQR